jgi:FAD/FMN-containing dehydrogenase
MSRARLDLRDLRVCLTGPAAARGDGAYGELVSAGFANFEVPWIPEAVVRCETVADVVAGVEFAASNRLKVAVRSGGVGWVGAPSGTVLLDMIGLAEIEVDTDARTVRAQAGAIWRDVHRRLAPYGLAAAGPQFPRLGVAGHVLGGGHGWLTRKLGWASAYLAHELGEVTNVEGRLGSREPVRRQPKRTAGLDMRRQRYLPGPL